MYKANARLTNYDKRRGSVFSLSEIREGINKGMTHYFKDDMTEYGYECTVNPDVCLIFTPRRIWDKSILKSYVITKI